MKTAQREKLLEALLDGIPRGTIKEFDDMFTEEIDRIAPLIDYWIADGRQESFKAGMLQAYLTVAYGQQQRQAEIAKEWLKNRGDTPPPF